MIIQNNTKRMSLKLCMLLLLSGTIQAREYHVSVKGDDTNKGTAKAPFQTISKAAEVALPGDVITVHEGTYRERINPPRGGESDTKRIVYRAAPREKVEIKGSEIITGWEKVRDGVWKVTISNSFFRDYNPYKDLITGDWFDRRGRDHHTGEVYLNGKSLYEMDVLEKVLNPTPVTTIADPEGSTYTWYCESDTDTTRIWANFHDYNPNEELVEINVRQCCFYPDKPGRNYITIRGFHISQAATQWAAPTAEQIGMIGTHWSKGWIIENNVISDSKCSGITLGKDRKSGHNVWSNDRSKGGAQHYNEVIFRALRNGWCKDKIGSHIIRNNRIFNCEQTGMCGSMGAAFSQVTNNHIYNIWTKRFFSGAEIGAIKFHAPIDVIIKNNRLHNSHRAMWMDWMTQGTRITGNLCYNNDSEDLFSEVNHGPYVVDNNLFLSKTAIRTWSEGGAYVHNLILGKIVRGTADRFTPYHVPHSTEVAGLINIVGGDDRYYNNIIAAGHIESPNNNAPQAEKATGYGLATYNKATLPVLIEGNVYYNGAKPYLKETNCIEKAEFDPEVKIVEEGDSVFLHITLDDSCHALDNPLVTTALLGRAKMPNAAYENPDGTPLKIDTDYFGKKRSEANPSIGPFANPGEGKLTLKVW